MIKPWLIGKGTLVEEYSLTYDGNGNDGGTAPVDANTYRSTEPITISNQGTLTKTGYSFTAWNTQADGLGALRIPTLTMYVSADTTIYAMWDED
jgi:uncharacterized repeat protein (TIGR02543 family)